MSSVRVLEHAPFATLAEARSDLLSAGADLDVRRLHAGDPVGDTSFDALIVLGGPTSAYSDENYPHRLEELELIRYCLESSTPFLGVCLGAQLLAVAAGGSGYSLERAEVGWTPVRILPAASEDLLVSSWPEEVVVMESHSDHFSLPAGAVLLGSSEACENELFRVGPAAWGMQFHPEAGVEFASTRLSLLASWEHFDPTSEIVVSSPVHVERFARFRREMFQRFAALASSRVPAQRQVRSLLET